MWTYKYYTTYCAFIALSASLRLGFNQEIILKGRKSSGGRSWSWESSACCIRHNLVPIGVVRVLKLNAHPKSIHLVCKNNANFVGNNPYERGIDVIRTLKKFYLTLKKFYLTLKRCYLALRKCYLALRKCYHALKKCYLALKKCYLALKKCRFIIWPAK